MERSLAAESATFLSLENPVTHFARSAPSGKSVRLAQFGISDQQQHPALKQTRLRKDEVEMAQLLDLLKQTETLHQHLCPRQILGVRMGMLSADLLELELPQQDKRLFTFVETDGCFADGVAVATGCTLGHRTMRLMDYGKAAATFVDTQTDRAIRIYPHPSSRTTATNYCSEAKSHWHAMLTAYQVIPAAELFCWQPVELTIDLKALISRHGLRVSCALCGEEIINEREITVDGQIMCRACAGDAYYTVQLESVTQV
jgi:formylmethanofuran dehydrogenase subunit E